MRKHFRAPWSTKLIGMSLVLLVILAFAFFSVESWGRYLIVGIALVAATFAIRGYSIHEGKLHIHRLGWSTKYDLANLESIDISPGATMGSVRAFGIGGLFGFVGHYHNSVLGSYKAYATNDANTVVIEFSGETIVVTPDSPVEFVEAVEAWDTLMQSGA